MHRGLHAEAQHSNQELLEEKTWLVPLISNLQWKLRRAEQKENAERDALMKNIDADARKCYEDKTWLVSLISNLHEIDKRTREENSSSERIRMYK